ncbi:MAG: alpha/beta fold hydrolase [Streptosporangiaceae bacterium]
MSAETDPMRSAAEDAAAAPLDLLLTDAATGMLRRVNPGGSGLRLAAALAARPRLIAERGTSLAGELARIAVGRSEVQPSRRDRRFADPGWAGNPLLRRAMQAYLAAAEAAEGVVAEAGLDGADTERVGFVLTNLIDALAPSNNPLLNPAAVKAAVDTGGGSALAGLRHFAADMAVAPRVPSMVEPDAFEVGVDLAVTPGSVVLRTPVFELIQYRPVTPAVRQVPLLIVPPVINKFYVMDLAPGRSMVEYLTGQGLQVFMISWRNPDARDAKWDLDTYGQAVMDAMDAAARITGSEQTALAGACSGGIIAAMVAAHLAHTGQQDRITALTLLVTVLDQARAGLASAVIDERTARLAAAASRSRGYLDGRALAEVFAWLRPNDLIWNYWVNNYLLGGKPTPFDILSWNGREQAVHAVGQRAHRRDGEPARQRQGQVHRWPGTARRTQPNGCGARRPATGPGGRTTRPGRPSAAARSKPPRPNWAAAGWRRSATRPEPTSRTVLTLLVRVLFSGTRIPTGSRT